MHELSMRDRHWCQKMKVSAAIYLFDIRAIDKTHNKVRAHELKMHFKLLNSARKLFLMANAPKIDTPCMIWKIYLYENTFCLFYFISIPKQSIFIKNLFVKLKPVSKLSSFLYTSCIYMHLQWLEHDNWVL
jgi:hypothetical protein